MSNRVISILKTTNIQRVWNLFLLKASFKISTLFKKPIHWGKPIAVSIEPTTACNLRCPQCPSGLRQFTRPTGNLKLEWNEQILSKLGKQIQYVNYYFQGEPFIHPHFLEIVKGARKRNIYTVTSTNAHFINEKIANKIIESGLSEAIISIDGTAQETYSNYRKEGNLSKVIEGTKALVAAKKEASSSSPHIVFQFLVTKQNENQINELQILAKEIGVDEVRLKTIQVYDLEGEGGSLIPSTQKYSRYSKNSSGKYELKNSFKNQCWRMWSSCVVTWDGKIVPCCFDKDATNEMGNILKEDFETIWKGQIYKGFRKSLQRSRVEIEICKNCSEGSKIWA